LVGGAAACNSEHADIESMMDIRAAITAQSRTRRMGPGG
jgi:hypothetical protein